MYPDVNDDAIATDEHLANRTILTTTNVMVHRSNDAVAARLDGDAHEYRSIDKLEDDDDWNYFEPEILNSVNIKVSGLKRLIDVMYPDVNDDAIATDEHLANRTILTTTNVMVHRSNDAVAARLDGDAHEYRSIDKLEDDDDWNYFEPEILNSVNIKVSGLKRLIDVMYPDVNDDAIATDEHLANRTILTTTNVMVHRSNDAVAARLDGDAHEYRSIDKLEDDDDWNYFEPEILNSVNIKGIPPHKLTLKKGAPIMLMRNSNPNLGLCNGTRLRVVELKPNVSTPRS
ncbi:unnamed protein product [Phytophthora fragariaefolia]|uniref:Unnamed protein product n=1 Tax=Phytophthora fragariaefolia TaxID=1490495 RepID=A0A9W7DAE4_9STRA|nr:unnamed protein product [Phytophthora fragariaefolia]